MLMDVHAGAASGGFLGPRRVGQLVFFQGCDARGCELWVSDGTAAGTRLVADIKMISDFTMPWLAGWDPRFPMGTIVQRDRIWVDSHGIAYTTLASMLAHTLVATTGQVNWSGPTQERLPPDWTYNCAGHAGQCYVWLGPWTVIGSLGAYCKRVRCTPWAKCKKPYSVLYMYMQFDLWREDELDPDEEGTGGWVPVALNNFHIVRIGADGKATSKNGEGPVEPAKDPEDFFPDKFDTPWTWRGKVYKYTQSADQKAASGCYCCLPWSRKAPPNFGNR